MMRSRVRITSSSEHYRLGHPENALEIGIPEDAMPHLFEEFFRAPNARTIEREGTGLGLSIVRETVNNLVANAVKYTPEGGRINVSLTRTTHEVTVNVSDTGIGIPEEAMPHLFEEFFRAPTARPASEQGTGLGLSISFHIIELHGGTIEIESTQGVGTACTIKLAVGPAKYQPLAKEESEGA